MKTVIYLMLFAALIVGAEAKKPKKQKAEPVASLFPDDPLWEFGAFEYSNGLYQAIWPYEDPNGYGIVLGPGLGEGLVVKARGQNFKITLKFLVDSLAN